MLFARVWSSRLKHDLTLAQALEHHVRQSAGAHALFCAPAVEVHRDMPTLVEPKEPKMPEVAAPQVLQFPAKHAHGEGELFEQPAQYCVTRSKKQLGLVELKN